MRSRLRTLRARFALWTAGLVLLVLAGFGAFVYLSLARGLLASIDDSLHPSAPQTAATLNIENGQIRRDDSLPESVDTPNLRDRGLTIRVLDPQGTILQASGPFRDLPVDRAVLDLARRGQAAFSTLALPDKEQVRFHMVPLEENGRLIAVVESAQSLETLQETLERLLVALLSGGALLLVVAGGGGYLLAARALAPIDEMTRAAGRISAENLSARLAAPPVDDEVGRLAATFNAMLERLEAAFRRERRFTADASHELRTPLAAMQTILGVVLARRRKPEEYEQALSDLSEQTDRLRSLVESLLFLARGRDAADSCVPQPVDLTALLQDVCDSFRLLVEEKGLVLTCDTPPRLSAVGDADGLVRLFANLLDNAIKYTAQGEIAVIATHGAEHVEVAISDSGIGIPAAQLPHVFERFYRGESARSTPGTGLGLAIAQEIARQHGGTIDVRSTVGRGATFTVRLPYEVRPVHMENAFLAPPRRRS